MQFSQALTSMHARTCDVSNAAYFFSTSLQDLRWSVDSPANVSVAAVQQLVTELNSKKENW